MSKSCQVEFVIMDDKGSDRERVKGGQLGARVIVAWTVIENTEVGTQTIVAPHVVSCLFYIPRVSLDHKYKGKNART